MCVRHNISTITPDDGHCARLWLSIAGDAAQRCCASCVLEDGAHMVSDCDVQVLVILGVVCSKTRREISFHWDGRLHIHPLTMPGKVDH